MVRELTERELGKEIHSPIYKACSRLASGQDSQAFEEYRDYLKSQLDEDTSWILEATEECGMSVLNRVLVDTPENEEYIRQLAASYSIFGFSTESLPIIVSADVYRFLIYRTGHTMRSYEVAVKRASMASRGAKSRTYYSNLLRNDPAEFFKKFSTDPVALSRLPYAVKYREFLNDFAVSIFSMEPRFEHREICFGGPERETRKVPVYIYRLPDKYLLDTSVGELKVLNGCVPITSVDTDELLFMSPVDPDSKFTGIASPILYSRYCKPKALFSTPFGQSLLDSTESVIPEVHGHVHEVGYSSSCTVLEYF